MSGGYLIWSGRCKDIHFILLTETQQLAKYGLVDTAHTIINWTFVEYINDNKDSCARLNGKFQFAINTFLR